MSEQLVAGILFALGAVGSVVIPYAREYVESGEAFNWRKLVGQLLAVVATIAAQAVGLFDQLAEATPVLAFAAGWGVSNAGRQAQKVYDVARDNWG